MARGARVCRYVPGFAQLLLRAGDGRRYNRPRAGGGPRGGGGSTDADDSHPCVEAAEPAILAYRTWLLAQKQHFALDPGRPMARD